MKRVGTVLCMMCLTLLLACGITGEAHAKDPIATMKAVQAVYMRSGPGPEHSIVTTIPGGAEVKVYDASSGWFEVEYSGKHGYTYCTFLTEKKSGSSSSSGSSGSSGGSGSSSGSSSSGSESGMVYFSQPIKYWATTGVRVRSGAGTGYSVIGSLKENESVAVLGSGKNWYVVQWNGGKGYVCCDYLTSSAPKKGIESSGSGSSAAAPAKTEVTGEKYITSTGLRMRATPANDGKIVCLIPEGATVGVLSKGHGDDGWWFEVNYGGYTGYSYAYYLYK